MKLMNNKKLNAFVESLLQPCPGCEAPYGFQNVMSLSQDTSRFAVSNCIHVKITLRSFSITSKFNF